LPGASNVTLFDWWTDNRQAVIAMPGCHRGNRHLWIADTVIWNARQITEGTPTKRPRRGAWRFANCLRLEEVDFDLTLITRRRPLASHDARDGA
jgi:hypothetical protein